MIRNYFVVKSTLFNVFLSVFDQLLIKGLNTSIFGPLVLFSTVIWKTFPIINSKTWWRHASHSSSRLNFFSNITLYTCPFCLQLYQALSILWNFRIACLLTAFDCSSPVPLLIFAIPRVFTTSKNEKLSYKAGFTRYI